MRVPQRNPAGTQGAGRLRSRVAADAPVGAGDPRLGDPPPDRGGGRGGAAEAAVRPALRGHAASRDRDRGRDPLSRARPLPQGRYGYLRSRNPLGGCPGRPPPASPPGAPFGPTGVGRPVPGIHRGARRGNAAADGGPGRAHPQTWSHHTPRAARLGAAVLGPRALRPSGGQEAVLGRVSTGRAILRAWHGGSRSARSRCPSAAGTPSAPPAGRSPRSGRRSSAPSAGTHARCAATR